MTGDTDSTTGSRATKKKLGTLGIPWKQGNRGQPSKTSTMARLIHDGADDTTGADFTLLQHPAVSASTV
jgi:hypothetical protein